ncbi:Serine/threonine-protein phosphatase 2A activator [Rhizophlyctis rosea]|uniref:Serine/threonine-protein phosphatase 2A activator n=1 Tax=Rhizophlyctis rosea TaxID=64517 RepID=A0AAD5X2S3_9FUNG|nr:Serine/threonine-protein phosphatase 2A activator [Rhizophlyctis rosea]
MFNPNSLLPTMPPPGTPIRPPQQQQGPIPLPKFTNHRSSIHIPDAYPVTAPTKRINDEATKTFWSKSEAFVRYLEFIQVLNEAAKNKKNSDDCYVSEISQKLLAMLDILNTWIDEIPPFESPQRFGNKAFRVWIQRLEANAESLLKDILPPKRQRATEELLPYLTGGFGHGTRIDYGSGHELSFVALLCCLDLLEVVSERDYQALVTRVFPRYLDVVRRLQKVYVLEPAGSHGVWGLDDHQFLPYYWGSSQLLDHHQIKPKTIMQRDVVSHFANEYLYLGCINYINEVKNGPFYEHSPMLFDISGVPLWSKVNTGMLKMYIAEVLMKFPVVQHLPLGTLLPFTEAQATASSAPSTNTPPTSDPSATTQQ